MDEEDTEILEIIFYDLNGILCRNGNDAEEIGRGRKETFFIGEDEQLVACKIIYQSWPKESFRSIRFTKWTIGVNEERRKALEEKKEKDDEKELCEKEEFERIEA